MSRLSRPPAAAVFAVLLSSTLGFAARAFVQEPDPVARLRGVVVERETQRPIAGARIFDLPSSRGTLLGLRELCVSAADGSFELAPDAASDGECLVRAPGRAAATFAPFVLAQEPKLELDRAATLSVHVRTNDALRSELRVVVDTPRHRLDAQARATPTGGLASWNAQLDTDGRARFDELPAGIELRLRLTAFADDRAPNDGVVTLAVGAPTEREYVLEAKADLRGTLRDKTHARDRGTLAGIASHEIWLARYVRDFGAERQPFETRVTTCTDANGDFEFEGLEPGVWVVGTPTIEHLLATAPDSRSLVAPTEFVVANFGYGRMRHAELYGDGAGYLVRGRVVDPFGESVAGAPIRFEPGVYDRTQPKTASDGSFVVGPIPTDQRSPSSPDGSAGARLLAASPHRDWSASAPVDIHGPTAELVLRLRRPASVSGTVVDERGELVIGAWIRLAPSDWERYTAESASWAIAPGRFEVQGVRAGRNWLFAGTRDGERMGVSPPLDLAEGETRNDVRLVLRPVGHVVLGSALYRTTRDTLAIEVDGVVVGSGRFATSSPRIDADAQRVPAGHVRVLRSDGEIFGTAEHATPLDEFDLAPGERRVVTIGK